jgi:hypothetical protein
MTTMTEPTTRTLEAPGATITYDVRQTDSPAPVLVLIGSPMGAGGFVTLASHFPDRTVVTYDPRGVERSVKADPASQSTPEQHADDLHRILGRARQRTGRPLRQQRWRRERARARGGAPGAGPDARRARAAACRAPVRSRGRAGGDGGDRRHVPAERVRPAMAQFIAS